MKRLRWSAVRAPGYASRRGGRGSARVPLNPVRSLAVVFVTAFIAGCAHDEEQWAPLMYLQAEIADGLADTYCSVRRLFGSDLPSSEFAARADPELIALAQRDAHRACLERLEAASEERARRLPGRNNL